MTIPATHPSAAHRHTINGPTQNGKARLSEQPLPQHCIQEPPTAASPTLTSRPARAARAGRGARRAAACRRTPAASHRYTPAGCPCAWPCRCCHRRPPGGGVSGAGRGQWGGQHGRRAAPETTNVWTAAVRLSSDRAEPDQPCTLNQCLMSKRNGLSNITSARYRRTSKLTGRYLDIHDISNINLQTFTAINTWGISK